MNANNEQRVPRSVIYNIAQFFRNHPAVFVTVLYVYISTVGVLHMWSLFREFGINVIDFAETNDFLLAAFKEPVALVLSVVTVAGVLLNVLWLVPRMMKAGGRPKSFRKFMHVLNIITLVVFAVAYTGIPAVWFARRRATAIKSGKGRKVVVELKTRIESEVLLIGMTEKFAFFYSQTKNRTCIVPIANILSIYVASVDSTQASSHRDDNSNKSDPNETEPKGTEPSLNQQ